MTRRRRWTILLIGLPLAIAIGGWIGLRVALPIVVRQQLTRVLGELGFPNASFTVARVSPWSTRIENIEAGDPLQIKVVEVRYAPLEVIGGKIESVVVRGGHWTLDLADIPAPATRPTSTAAQPPPPAAPFPVRSIVLEKCLIRLQQRGHTLELPLDATLTRIPSGELELDAKSAIEGSSVLASGLLDATGDLQTLKFSAEKVGVAPLVALLPTGAANAVGEVSGTLTARAEVSRQKGALLGNASVTAPALSIMGFELTNVDLAAARLAEETVSVTTARLGWAGGTLLAEPFSYNLEQQHARITLLARGVQLREALRVFASGRATGTGTAGARAVVVVDGSRITMLEGQAASEGTGQLRLGESVTSLGDILDQSDPRYAQGQMRDVKQRIMEALKDFEYDKLNAQLVHAKPEPVVVLQISGHGRSGTRQPLDLTLNLRGFDAGLNAYLAGKSGVLNVGD